MTTRMTGVIGCGVLFFGALACKANEDAFYSKVFPCQESGSPDQCGSDRQNRPMACYPGHLLEGQDFCVSTCDPSVDPADPRFTCIEAGRPDLAGALLQKCRPTAGRNDPRYGCPATLSCYRTDLQTDEGICLMMTVCTEHGDCGGSGKKCGGALLRGLLTGSTDLMTDSLQCVRTECTMQSSQCPEDQACFLNNFASQGMLPDICVPRCDSGHRCPPNFACAFDEIVAPGARDVCVPGIPGTRCRADQDCMAGVCTDTGAGFSACALPIPCKPRDYCASLNGPVDVFVCAEGIPGQFRCVTSRAFSATCDEPGKCPAETGQECFFFSPDKDVPDHGDCRVPCPPDRRCEARGGIPFFCLGENGEGGCYAGQFGLPCLDTSECPGNLTCELVGPDARSRTNYSPNICTTPCASDADCDANPLTFHGGFCDTTLGFCRLAGQPEAPCTQDTHCRSRRCGPATGRCF